MHYNVKWFITFSNICGDVIQEYWLPMNNDDSTVHNYNNNNWAKYFLPSQVWKFLKYLCHILEKIEIINSYWNLPQVCMDRYILKQTLAFVICWCSKRGLFFIIVRSKCWCKCWKCFIVRNEDIVSDFDLMLMRKKEEMRKRKKRRRDVDIINDNDDLIADMIVKMKEAAEVSKVSYYS